MNQTTPNSEAYLKQDEQDRQQAQEAYTYFSERKAMLDELDLLIALLKAMRGDSNLVNRGYDTESQAILGRLQGAINSQLDLLYPEQVEGYIDLREEAVLEEYNIVPVKQYSLDNNISLTKAKDEDIDRATDTTHYHSYNNAMDLTKKGCGKIARKNWDNTLNQEYVIGRVVGVQDDLLYGFIKHYTMVTPSYYKKVEHTYKPTKEDIEATDWYIL